VDNASSFENDLIVPTTNSLTEGQRPAVPGQHLALRDVVMRRTPRPASKVLLWNGDTEAGVRRSDEFTADDRNPANSAAFQGAAL